MMSDQNVILHMYFVQIDISMKQFCNQLAAVTFPVENFDRNFNRKFNAELIKF